MYNNKEKTSFILLIISLLFTTGFTFVKTTPQQLYRVYLKGETLGLIRSKKELEEYIDKKQIEIKEKYKVDKVYLPSDLDVVKEITYSNKTTSIKKIYNKIKDISPFTIKGYQISIKGIDKIDSEGNVVKGKNRTIYVLDKKIFEKAVDHMVKSFIPPNEYESFANNSQKKIEDTGEIIEKIYIKNKITIKKQNIPVNKTIYQDDITLSQYLLFGTTQNQKTYSVQAGDTINDVSFNNKVSIEEFLVANPKFINENSLLYPGQIVTIGIVKPQFDIVEVDYLVKREQKKYSTETIYDKNKYIGYTATKQKGKNGEIKVTQRITKVNGEKTSIEPLNTEIITPPVNEIIIKGQKRGGGFGIPIETKGQWGWPATCSTISSPFGWRWGALHDGTDIAGCGYGSNIFASQAGVVVQSKKKPGRYPGGYGDNGEYIIIDHENGYYTLYAHLCTGCRYVKVGDRVEKGQVIGGMGMTGAATGVHLHFGFFKGYPYRRGSIALDAMRYAF